MTEATLSFLAFLGFLGGLTALGWYFWLFQFRPDPPETVTIFTNGLHTTVRWDEVEEADYYAIEIYNPDRDLFSRETVTGTMFRHDSEDPDINYGFRVRASVDGEWSSWTAFITTGEE